MADRIKNEPCPECGDTYSTEWVDADASGDTWRCRECGHEWRITITAVKYARLAG
jgi:uncharacterized Zn finger protein